MAARSEEVTLKLIELWSKDSIQGILLSAVVALTTNEKTDISSTVLCCFCRLQMILSLLKSLKMPSYHVQPDVDIKTSTTLSYGEAIKLHTFYYTSSHGYNAHLNVTPENTPNVIGFTVASLKGCCNHSENCLGTERRNCS